MTTRTQLQAINDLNFDEAMQLIELINFRARDASMSTQEYFQRWAVGDMPSALRISLADRQRGE